MGVVEVHNTVGVKFRYSGDVRHVDNVTFEPQTKTFIGMEVRKAGKFSWKIKRFKLNDIESPLQFVPGMKREVT